MPGIPATHEHSSAFAASAKHPAPALLAEWAGRHRAHRPFAAVGTRPRQGRGEQKGRTMAAESSFDVVSKVDRQEVDNALNQAVKEVGQRFDFKNTDAKIAWSGENIEMEAVSEERVKAILDVFQSKLVRRGVSLKALETGEPRVSGKLWKITATLENGISADNARKVAKLIRDSGPKGIRTQIQGDELRVFSKKRDDLQAVQKLVLDADHEFAVQFTNYR